MTRRRFAAAAGLVLASSVRGMAETQQERAKRVIDKCLDALGGDAFRQMPGHLQIGSAYSFYNDEISGLSPAKIYTKYLEPGQPFREVQCQLLGKNDEEKVILTATEGWDITYRGAEAVPADRLERFRENLLTDIFYILRARMDEPDNSWFSRGADVVENQPVEIVDFFDADRRSVTVWIHSSTWLPVRQLVKRWDPQIKDRRDEITRFTKFADAGNGVMWPHTVWRERDGEKTFQLFADSAKVGVYPDSMFKLPPGVKMVEKKRAVEKKKK